MLDILKSSVFCEVLESLRLVLTFDDKFGRIDVKFGDGVFGRRIKMGNELTLTKIAIFKGKQVRKTIHNDEWWFVVNDAAILSEKRCNIALSLMFPVKTSRNFLTAVIVN